MEGSVDSVCKHGHCRVASLHGVVEMKRSRREGKFIEVFDIGID